MLSNRLENPDVLRQVVTVDEHTTNETSVADVRIRGEIDSSYRYEIVGGNEAGALAIDEATGAITVADSDALDHEQFDAIGLRVRVTDTADPSVFGVGLTRVRLRDINEALTVADGVFTVAAGSPNATVIGQLDASDADARPGLTYRILGGNSENAVALHSLNGKLRVADPDVLQAGDVFELVVEVRDRGDLFDTARIQINVV